MIPQKLKNLLLFYGDLHRPLSYLEIQRLLPGDKKPDLSEIIGVVDRDTKDGGGFFDTVGTGSFERRLQDLLLDEKWRKLLKLAQWLDWIPFIDFVLASGSLSLGNVTPDSDFDVLTGVRRGRAFTARYLTLLVFALLRSRRLDDIETSSPNKLCFNHFVTDVTYSKPPHNYYRYELYRSLVPVWGDPQAIGKFIGANGWSGISAEIMGDRRYRPARKKLLTKILESALGGPFGDLLEKKVFAPIARKRLGVYFEKKGDNGRAVLSDDELEFHFDLNYERQFHNLMIDS
jgi:hypothetical protein